MRVDSRRRGDRRASKGESSYTSEKGERQVTELVMEGLKEKKRQEEVHLVSRRAYEWA
jgi:hypothetical protein